ncbi:hypothetical protein E4U55_004638 [Claviceps digitariae]|nr:hypothetical protein E4U55_004638 [Claviceps digitariae]
MGCVMSRTGDSDEPELLMGDASCGDVLDIVEGFPHGALPIQDETAWDGGQSWHHQGFHLVKGAVPAGDDGSVADIEKALLVCLRHGPRETRMGVERVFSCCV